jgi:hypothetical protein
MMSSRSLDTPSGSTATNRTPRAPQAMAKAMDVDPLDASTTVVPGWTRPAATARLSTWAASRSLVDPLGSWYSSLSHMVQPLGASSQGTVGVVMASTASRRSGANGRVAVIARWSHARWPAAAWWLEPCAGWPSPAASWPWC